MYASLELEGDARTNAILAGLCGLAVLPLTVFPGIQEGFWWGGLFPALLGTLAGYLAWDSLNDSYKKLQARMMPWELQIDDMAIRATGRRGQVDYEIPWSQIEKVTIAHIGAGPLKPGELRGAFEGIHLRLTRDASPLTEGPAGWPVPGTKLERNSLSLSFWWTPLCVLGPMTPEQRERFDEVIAKYAGRRLEYGDLDRNVISYDEKS